MSEPNITVTSFGYFPRLPAEIRRAIWLASIVPRVIVTTREADNSCTRTALRSQRKPPAILHVCFEARQVALEKYAFIPRFGYWEEATECHRLNEEDDVWYDGEERIELDYWLWFNRDADTVFLKRDSTNTRSSSNIDPWPPSPHLILGEDGYECIRDSNHVAFDRAEYPPATTLVGPRPFVFDFLPTETSTFLYVAGALAIHPSAKGATASEMKGLFEGHQKVAIVDIADTARLGLFFQAYRPISGSIPLVHGPRSARCFSLDGDVLGKNTLEAITYTAEYNLWVRNNFHSYIQGDWLDYQLERQVPLKGEAFFDDIWGNHGMRTDNPWVKETLATTPKVQIVLVFFLCEDEEHLCMA